MARRHTFISRAMGGVILAAAETRNGVPLRPPQLARTRRWSVYLIAAGVWLSGAAWIGLHYFFMRESEFGATPHPLEFWSLVTHGAFAFAAVWLFGLLWAAHVTAGWRSTRRRWTGATLFGLLAWFIVSGYLLYYLGAEDVRETVDILHWGVGLISPLPFLLHRFARDSARPRQD